MTIKLKNNVGLLKTVPTGFSWTTLFFGGFVPLIRGDLKWFAIMLFLAFFSFGISWLIFPFVYNKVFIKGLLEKGFTTADEEANKYLAAKGYIVK